MLADSVDTETGYLRGILVRLYQRSRGLVTSVVG
jgi:hypothetical protein